MFKDSKKIREILSQIDVILNKKLQNKELYDYIRENLIMALNSKRHCFKEVSENIVEIIDTKNNDVFRVEFLPNIMNFQTIKTYRTCWDGKNQEFKEIIFGDGRIDILEDELGKIVYNESNLISCLERKRSIKTYLENELSYIYYFKSETSHDLKYLRSCSTEEETYINKNRQAVRRTSTVGDRDSFEKTGIVYWKTNFYDEPKFNTREDNKGLYQFGMSYSNEEEFNKFLKAFYGENNLKLTNKKQS